MFLKTLRASDRAWRRERGLGSRWNELGEGVEFSIDLARWPEGPKTSRIAVRSKDKKFDEIKISVELHDGSIVHDETRIVSNLDENPRVVHLSSLPAYRTIIGDDGLDWPYEYYKVRLLSLTENGSTRAVNRATLPYTPIDQTLANADHWIPWDGMALNVALIRWQQEELKNRWWRRLGHPQMGLGWAYSGVSLPRYLLARVAFSKPVIRTAYWLPLVLGLRKFDPNDRGVCSRTEA